MCNAACQNTLCPTRGNAGCHASSRPERGMKGHYMECSSHLSSRAPLLAGPFLLARHFPPLLPLPSLPLPSHLGKLGEEEEHHAHQQLDDDDVGVVEPPYGGDDVPCKGSHGGRCRSSDKEGPRLPPLLSLQGQSAPSLGCEPRCTLRAVRCPHSAALKPLQMQGSGTRSQQQQVPQLLPAPTDGGGGARVVPLIK